MKFDAYAALAHLRQDPNGRAICAIRAIPQVANSTNSMSSTEQTVDAETRLQSGGASQIAQTASTAPQARLNQDRWRGHGNPGNLVPTLPDIGQPRPAVVPTFVASPEAELMASPPVPPSAARYEEPPINADGYCRTWLGRVVSPSEWQHLGAWDRYGPGGRLFCGICWVWVARKDGCGQAGCWKAEGGVA